MTIKDDVRRSLMLWLEPAAGDRQLALKRFISARKALDDLLALQITFKEYVYILDQLGVDESYWELSKQNLGSCGLWLSG